jgi:hypothetical protein
MHVIQLLSLFPAPEAMFRISKCIIITIKSSHLQCVYFYYWSLCNGVAVILVYYNSCVPKPISRCLKRVFVCRPMHFPSLICLFYIWPEWWLLYIFYFSLSFKNYAASTLLTRTPFHDISNFIHYRHNILGQIAKSVIIIKLVSL